MRCMRGVCDAGCRIGIQSNEIAPDGRRDAFDEGATDERVVDHREPRVVDREAIEFLKLVLRRHDLNVKIVVDRSDQPVTKLRVQIVGPIIAIGMPAHDLHTGAIENIGGGSACIRKQAIVVADEGDELAGSIGEGHLPILGHRDDRFGHKMADAGVIGLLQERRSFGVGTIILDDDLKVLVRLRDGCCESVPERVRASQRGNDDRESRHREG